MELQSRLITWQNLSLAYQKASRGKRGLAYKTIREYNHEFTNRRLNFNFQTRESINQKQNGSFVHS